MTQPGDLIEELRKIRVSNRVAQADLSEASGYSRAMLARYEAGKYVPEHLQMLCNWAEALGHDLVLRAKE